MINLPPGIDIDKLISDLRMFSWEASDILVRYAQMLRDPNNKIKIIEDKKNNDAVTKADLEVNELIIKKIRKNYKKISKILNDTKIPYKWHIFNLTIILYKNCFPA